MYKEKKDKMIAYSSLPLRAQPVLQLFPFKKSILGNWLAKHCSASEYAFFFDTERVQVQVTTAAFPVDELVPPPEQLLTILF